MNTMSKNNADRIEDRLRPVLVFTAWALALPIGAIIALYHGYVGLGAIITANALALGWCDV